MQSSKPLFLHVTDAHLAPDGGPHQNFKEADIKSKLPGIEMRDRLTIFRQTLSVLAEHLAFNKQVLDGVIVSGDATHQGAAGSSLRDLLTKELKIEPAKIIVVPGNHDVICKTPPSDKSRYERFIDAWRTPEPCVTPLLDGIETTIDGALQGGTFKHLLRDPENRWVVIPINSSNWCQINRSASKLLMAHLSELKSKGVKEKGEIAKEIEDFLAADVARVSPDQLAGLERILSDVPPQALRIAVLHHHLLPVSTDEEIKPFADIVNLGLLRQFLRQHNIRVVVHGHKHRSQLYYDHIYDERGDKTNAHRVLVVSGGTLMSNSIENNEPFRLIEFNDLPHAPICDVSRVPLKKVGVDWAPLPKISKRIWEPDETHNGPISIFGSDVSDVYARAKQLVSAEGKHRPLICTLNLPQDKVKPKHLIPVDYALQYMGAEPEQRLEQMVDWWQLPSSRIEKRIPFIHGTRLRNYGGSFDQLDNVVQALSDNPGTSKAIAVLIDPIRDLAMKPPSGFASFCLVQFCGRVNENLLDCIGYYRAQEFLQWWPVNIAELRHMQAYVAERVNMGLGTVTTVTGDARVAADIRTPTQVAVPLIDQWLDTHPERIPMMSRAVAGCQATTKCADSGMKYLKQCLDDIYMSTATKQEDGNPIAIDGLDFLIRCLTQECSTIPKVAEVIEHLQSLLEINTAFDLGGEFSVWQKNAQKCINVLAMKFGIELARA